MTLLERVTTEIAAAMKAKDQARLAPLRMLKTALTNRQVEKGRELEDTEDRQVVASLVKQRHDSIDQFRRGGRDDLAAREEAEIGVLTAYLPAAPDEAMMSRLVEEAIAETGATTAKDLGRVMKTVMPRLAGFTVDGRHLNDLVRRKLSGNEQ